ncbi:MAG: hypothetical protein HYV07_13980 [Deltaproteobacteria bacterium]|nr:hypothetical protein [Deltaproteobacteria bacterium]
MLRIVFRSILAASVIAVAACDDESSENDGGLGDAVAPDAPPRYDGGPLPDTGPRPDSGPAVDAGAEDLRCVENGVIAVGAANVSVDETTTPATVAGGSPDLSCVGEDAPRVLAGGVTFRACLHVLGGTLTRQQAEDQLSIAIFKSFDDQGTEDRVDPAKSADGSDRRADRRISPDVVYSTNVDCPSGVQVELGRAALAEHQLKADLPYVIRLSDSSTIAGSGGRWATSYVFGAAVNTSDLEAGSGLGGNCSPNVCRGRVDLFAAGAAWLKDQVTRTGAVVEGGTDLTDGVGDGYAMVQTNDCKDAPLEHATAGFAPEPSEAAYLGADRVVSPTATETADLGLYLGLGFADTSSTSPTTITAAVGVSSDGTCTEEYAGAQLFVYPDALSVLRAGHRAVLR